MIDITKPLVNHNGVEIRFRQTSVTKSGLVTHVGDITLSDPKYGTLNLVVIFDENGIEANGYRQVVFNKD